MITKYGVVLKVEVFMQRFLYLVFLMGFFPSFWSISLKEKAMLTSICVTPLIIDVFSKYKKNWAQNIKKIGQKTMCMAFMVDLLPKWSLNLLLDY